MYNPTDRLEQALGTRSDRRSSDPQLHISRAPKGHPNHRTGLAGPKLSWENLGLVLASFQGPSGSGRHREGRDGHGLLLGLEHALVPGRTECNHTWGWLGKAWGSGEELPGCRHRAEHSLCLLGAAGRGPGLIRGRGCDLGLFGRKEKQRKKERKERNST